MSLMSKMSRGGAQRVLRWGLLISMFAGYALAEDEVFKFRVIDKTPTKLVIDKLNETFGNSGRVDVKYTDLNSGVESAHYNKDLVTTQWQYLFSRQCDTGCDYVGVELHRG